ncbi:anti-CBASS protein Acb1 family protein [Pseudorhodoferax sp. Leaf265]|uniref:anti-CBASS protein Acb1 family protein n=1 Tax=Pseudorhodoferax sp. Leaf265 TaxID=1736315 RepID=UPI0006F45793|nr:anti-CBASS Acb1 family protein [Pseudorhodoferax sp. Leaf265]KQP02469.1 hypothetical protein ASF45_20660 [Pseudorhodoferax sp. Leaf265]
MPDQLAVNTYELARAREDFARAFGALDAKRPTAWAQYGYPEHISFPQYLQAYSRGGPGHGAVHRLLDKCWQGNPRIKSPTSDEETPWEVGVKKLLDGILAWKKFKDLDRRNMVGRYAALIYRVGDGKALREPMETAQRLVNIVPLYEDQIKVTQWHNDPNQENFGQPAMFQYRMRSPSNLAIDTQGRPDEWADVHPSRVQILAEGSAGDMFDGVPLLQAGFNDLVDLEKITGGSAESFLKNSARTLVFEYEKDAAVSTIAQPGADGTPAKTVRQVHSDQTRELNRNQDSSIVIQGGKANTLQTSISDPRGAFEVAACSFAASVQIPFTILFGQQTGRLASDEDKEDMAARCTARQKNELTPMLTEFVARMQAAGIIEKGEFEIEWPAVNAPSDKDKQEILEKATSSMQKAFQAGLTEPLFDANELRAIVEYEPRADDGMPEEGDPEEDAQADPDAQRQAKAQKGAAP